MDLNQWAIQWGIPFDAVEDLRRKMQDVSTESHVHKIGLSEAAVQNDIRLEASKKGMRIWRNNVGVAMDENNKRTVRYGLCNDSKKMNAMIKSSDLIGIRPRVIFPADVGTVIGQFVAREVKPELWAFSGTDREIAQQRFIELINSLGGDAQFATREGTL